MIKYAVSTAVALMLVATSASASTAGVAAIHGTAMHEDLKVPFAYSGTLQPVASQATVTLPHGVGLPKTDKGNYFLASFDDSFGRALAYFATAYPTYTDAYQGTASRELHNPNGPSPQVVTPNSIVSNQDFTLLHTTSWTNYYFISSVAKILGYQWTTTQAVGVNTNPGGSAG